MSNGDDGVLNDPDLPDYLIEAILAEAPPADAIDLVKNAFTWRTIDAELMELAYDSVLDDAGVRDAGTRRTLEFALGEISLVLEISETELQGQVSSPQSVELVLTSLSDRQAIAVDAVGGFVIAIRSRGPVRIDIEAQGITMSTPSFVL